jgi:hypothetical protein
MWVPKTLTGSVHNGNHMNCKNLHHKFEGKAEEEKKKGQCENAHVLLEYETSAL